MLHFFGTHPNEGINWIIWGRWHTHKKISQEVFEDAFITFCRVGLLDVDWVNDGLDEIYKAVTGQEADIDRLDAIEDLFSFYD